MRAGHIGEGHRVVAEMRDGARGAADHVDFGFGVRRQRADQTRLARTDLAEHGDIEFFAARAAVEFLEFVLQRRGVGVLLAQCDQAQIDLRARRRRFRHRFRFARSEEIPKDRDHADGGSCEASATSHCRNTGKSRTSCHSAMPLRSAPNTTHNNPPSASARTAMRIRRNGREADGIVRFYRDRAAFLASSPREGVSMRLVRRDVHLADCVLGVGTQRRRCTPRRCSANSAWPKVCRRVRCIRSSRIARVSSGSRPSTGSRVTTASVSACSGTIRTIPHSIAGNDVTTIFIDRDDRIWCGLESHGLDMLDAARGTFVHYVNDPENPTIADGRRRVEHRSGRRRRDAARHRRQRTGPPAHRRVARRVRSRRARRTRSAQPRLRQDRRHLHREEWRGVGRQRFRSGRSPRWWLRARRFQRECDPTRVASTYAS